MIEICTIKADKSNPLRCDGCGTTSISIMDTNYQITMPSAEIGLIADVNNIPKRWITAVAFVVCSKCKRKLEG